MKTNFLLIGPYRFLQNFINLYFTFFIFKLSYISFWKYYDLHNYEMIQLKQAIALDITFYNCVFHCLLRHTILCYLGMKECYSLNGYQNQDILKLCNWKTAGKALDKTMKAPSTTKILSKISLHSFIKQIKTCRYYSFLNKQNRNEISNCS